MHEKKENLSRQNLSFLSPPNSKKITRHLGNHRFALPGPLQLQLNHFSLTFIYHLIFRATSARKKNSRQRNTLNSNSNSRSMESDDGFQVEPLNVDHASRKVWLVKVRLLKIVFVIEWHSFRIFLRGANSSCS